MADQLATLSQVKARITISDTDDDALISELIDQVSAWVQGYTGRKFLPETGVTYVFDTAYGSVLSIPRGIRAVTSLGIATLSHQPDSGGVYTTITSANILLRPASGDRAPGWPATEIRLSRASTYVYGTIENGAIVTGDFGWSATPLDIQAVVIDAVVTAYNVRKMGASGVIGADDIAIPPWSQFFSRGSPQRGTLDRYAYRTIS